MKVILYPFELYMMGVREGDNENKYMVDDDNNIVDFPIFTVTRIPVTAESRKLKDKWSIDWGDEFVTLTMKGKNN